MQEDNVQSETVVIGLFGLGALILLFCMICQGCTTVTIRSLPDQQWSVEYRTFLKEIKVDRVKTFKTKDGQIELVLENYQSTETKALELANEIVKKLPAGAIIP